MRSFEAPATRREDQESAWKLILVEIEEGLVPAFIIEGFEDGRFTVFVPLVPTPLAGAVYILNREGMHPLDVPFWTAAAGPSHRRMTRAASAT